MIKVNEPKIEIIEQVKVDNNYIVRVVKHFSIMVLLWIPIFYLVFNRLEHNYSVAFIALLLIYILANQLYKNKFAIKRVYVQDEIIKVEYFYYNNFKTDFYKIKKTRFDYSENGIILKSGKLCIYFDDELKLFQYNSQKWKDKRLKKCSENFFLIKNRVI